MEEKEELLNDQRVGYSWPGPHHHHLLSAPEATSAPRGGKDRMEAAGHRDLNVLSLRSPTELLEHTPGA